MTPKNFFTWETEGASQGTGIWMYVMSRELTTIPSSGSAFGESGMAKLTTTEKLAFLTNRVGHQMEVKNGFQLVFLPGESMKAAHR